MAQSVYQSKEYKEALEVAGEEIVEIDENFYALEKQISLPILGKKRILEGRGTPSKESVEKFKEKSKNYFYGTIMPSVLDSNDGFFTGFGFNKVDNYTILVDLSQDEEDLWKNLEKKSSRWGVKTAGKNELSFEQAREEDIDKFYNLYKSTAESGNFEAETKEFLMSIMQSKTGKLFMIKHKDKIVAGGLILLDRGRGYSILDLTTASEEGMKLQAMPFLYWKLILYSKTIGLKYFDLGGYDNEAKKGDKTYNVNKFKERFGGVVVTQPIFSTNKKYSFLRGVLRKARFMKNWYRKD